MSSNKQSGGGGCALIIGGMLVLFLLLWAIKIALIVLGVALIIAAPILAIAIPISLWYGVTQRPASQAALEEFDDSLALVATDSARRLSSAITAWDDLQRNRGVGTRLEKAYFADHVDDATQKLFEEISFYVEYGEELLDAAESPSDRDDREARIDRIQEQDETTLQLESLRRRVRQR